MIKATDFPPAHFESDGHLCWRYGALTVWLRPDGRADICTSFRQDIPLEQALALARAASPSKSTEDAGGIIRRQLEMHGVTITDGQAKDAAAQVLQALPVIGEEE